MMKPDQNIVENEELPSSEELYCFIASILDNAEIYSLNPSKSPLSFIYDHSRVDNIDKRIISNLTWPLAIKIVITYQLFDKSGVIQ